MKPVGAGQVLERGEAGGLPASGLLRGLHVRNGVDQLPGGDPCCGFLGRVDALCDSEPS